MERRPVGSPPPRIRPGGRGNPDDLDDAVRQTPDPSAIAGSASRPVSRRVARCVATAAVIPPFDACCDRTSAVRPKATRATTATSLSFSQIIIFKTRSPGKFDNRLRERPGGGCNDRASRELGEFQRDGCPWLRLRVAWAFRPRRRRARGRASCQPLPQPEPAPGQPALDRRHRPVELPGRLVISHPLEVAELDGASCPTSPAAGPVPGPRRCGGPRAHVGAGSSDDTGGFGRSPTLVARLGTGPQRDAVGDPVEPSAEGVVHPHRPGLADEDEEGGLEHVLGLMSPAKHALTDPQTIAPWRSIRAAKAISAAVAASADSARLAVYRSRSSMSVSPVAVPAANRSRSCRNG